MSHQSSIVITWEVYLALLSDVERKLYSRQPLDTTSIALRNISYSICSVDSCRSVKQEGGSSAGRISAQRPGPPGAYASTIVMRLAATCRQIRLITFSSASTNCCLFFHRFKDHFFGIGRKRTQPRFTGH